MKKFFRMIYVWLFLPSGLLVSWALHGQTLGMTAMIICLYGFCMVFMGCFLSMANVECRHKDATEALENLRAQYESSLTTQRERLRQALLILTCRSLKVVAGKLVTELLPNLDNDEQFESAVLRAETLVESELKDLYEIVHEENVGSN